jgi:hypothetical protein
MFDICPNVRPVEPPLNREWDADVLQRYFRTANAASPHPYAVSNTPRIPHM